MAAEVLPLSPSSNIQGATYDPDTLECVVTFKGGGRYVVSDVSTSEAESFSSAQSSGKFYNEFFRNAKVVTKA